MVSKLFLVIFGAGMMVLGIVTYLRNRQRVQEFPAEVRPRAEEMARNSLIFSLLIGSLALITATMMQAMGVRALFSGTQRDLNTIMSGIMIGFGVLLFGIMSWKQRQIRQRSQQTSSELSEQDAKHIVTMGKMKYKTLGLFVFWGLLMLL